LLSVDCSVVRVKPKNTVHDIVQEFTAVVGWLGLDIQLGMCQKILSQLLVIIGTTV